MSFATNVIAVAVGAVGAGFLVVLKMIARKMFGQIQGKSSIAATKNHRAVGSIYLEIAARISFAVLDIPVVRTIAVKTRNQMMTIQMMKKRRNQIGRMESKSGRLGSLNVGIL